MNQQVFRNNNYVYNRSRDQDDTISECEKLSNLNCVSGIHHHLQQLSSKSFDRIVVSNPSFSFCQVDDSRDPEDDGSRSESRSEQDKRTEASRRYSQDILLDSSMTGLKKVNVGSLENESSSPHVLTSHLKRANPIYEESDTEYERTDSFECNSNVMRKRRCSIEKGTTAVYWHNELTSALE